MRQLACLVLLALLSACQVFTRADTPATLRAENISFIAEATSIAQTAQAQTIRVETTAVAASTTIAQMNNINLQLRATARALIPPTAQIVSSGVDTASAGEGMQFSEFGMATAVRDSDGCAANRQTVFSTNTPAIYITARTFNIRAGTEMKVEWHYQGQTVHQESFVVPVDDDDYCVWFNIDPNTTPFLPGSWTVRLYALQSTAQRWIDAGFTIEDAMGSGG